MPPKRVYQSKKDEPSIFSTISSIAAPENRSIVTAVALFSAGVAFFHSSWSEILQPVYQ